MNSALIIISTPKANRQALETRKGLAAEPLASTDASFTFDDAGDVSDWSFSTLDGPPDYFNTPSTDSIVVGDAEYIADPGSWSVAIIPLPASSALLLTTALSAFGVTRMRRNRKKAPLG